MGASPFPHPPPAPQCGSPRAGGQALPLPLPHLIPWADIRCCHSCAVFQCQEPGSHPRMRAVLQPACARVCTLGGWGSSCPLGRCHCLVALSAPPTPQSARDSGESEPGSHHSGSMFSNLFVPHRHTGSPHFPGVPANCS